MRCPDCNKFVPQTAGDLDVQSEDCDEEGSISVECRITQVCEECGTELKEATILLEFDAGDEGHAEPEFMHDDVDVTEEMDDALAVTLALYLLLTDMSESDLKGHLLFLRDGFVPKHEFEIEVNLDNDTRYEGKGRGKQTFYGVSGSIDVKCSCGWEHTIEVSVADNGVAASAMDEC
jgi:hypothetical protein